MTTRANRTQPPLPPPLYWYPLHRVVETPTQVRMAEASFIDDRTSTSNGEAVKVSSAKHVFRTVGGILAPIRVGTPIIYPPVDSR